MSTFLDSSERKFNRLLISAGELTKTCFQELWRFFFRSVAFFAAILLMLFHQKSLKHFRVIPSSSLAQPTLGLSLLNQINDHPYYINITPRTNGTEWAPSRSLHNHPSNPLFQRQSIYRQITTDKLAPKSSLSQIESLKALKMPSTDAIHRPTCSLTKIKRNRSYNNLVHDSQDLHDYSCSQPTTQFAYLLNIIQSINRMLATPDDYTAANQSSDSSLIDYEQRQDRKDEVIAPAEWDVKIENKATINDHVEEGLLKGHTPMLTNRLSIQSKGMETSQMASKGSPLDPTSNIYLDPFSSCPACMNTTTDQAKLIIEPDPRVEQLMMPTLKLDSERFHELTPATTLSHSAPSVLHSHLIWNPLLNEQDVIEILLSNGSSELDHSPHPNSQIHPKPVNGHGLERYNSSRSLHPLYHDRNIQYGDIIYYMDHPIAHSLQYLKPLRFPKINLNRDLVFTSEKINTGILEDIRMAIFLMIDQRTNDALSYSKALFHWLRKISLRGLLSSFRSPRWLFHQITHLIWHFLLGFLFMLFYPIRILSHIRLIALDKRKTKEIIENQGYPYECYEVITEDGYIIRLERLARRNAKHVLYFQHGVVDNSFAWFGHVEGEMASALAYRAYDRGFDIFVGTFRGCENTIKHVNPNIPASEYWNFSVNEHAMKDLPAFIRRIVEIKRSEASSQSKVTMKPEVTSREFKAERDDEPKPIPVSTDPNTSQTKMDQLPVEEDPFKIAIVAHSMGAMATLMYLIWYHLRGISNHVSSAILLSPAGYHKTAPFTFYIIGHLLNSIIFLFPFIHSLKFPSTMIRLLVAKLFEDLNNSLIARNIVSWFVSKIIGGSVEDHTLFRLRNLIFNIFSGTSVGVYKHLWQIIRRHRFEGYDYGPRKNLLVYGTKKPINFLSHYHRLDIPICFVTGLNDILIEPISVMGHYEAHKLFHPHKSFFMAFPRLGHMDFTIGADESLISFILQTCTDFSQLSGQLSITK